MKDELDVQNMDVTMPLTIAVAGAFLLLGAAGILWYGYGASVALAMMAGDAFLNCF